MQIENALTACEGILEAAVVSVPDGVYGEVAGAWIVRRPGEEGDALTRENAREAVKATMNPQVRLSLSLSRLRSADEPRMHRAGCGL